MDVDEGHQHEVKHTHTVTTRLVFPLRNRLAYGLHNLLQLLDRSQNPTLDQLQLGHDGCLELLQRGLVRVDVLDRVLASGVLANEVILACHRVIERRKMRGKPLAEREEVRDRFRVCFGVLEQLVGRLLDGGEAPRIVFEFRIAGFCELGTTEIVESDEVDPRRIAASADKIIPT